MTAPTALAGADQTQCNNGSFTLTGNLVSVGTGTWTVESGTATVTSIHSATSSVIGLPVGTTAVLRWTIVNGICSSYDEVSLTNNVLPMPLELSGSTICFLPGGNGTISSSTSVNGVNYQLYNSANSPLQPSQSGTGSGLVWSNLSAGSDYYVIATDNAHSCTSSSNTADISTYLNPTTPSQTIDCSQGFGNAVITVTNPTGTGIGYSLDNGTYQTGVIFTGVTNGSHTISVRNASGCTTIGNSFTVSCGCINGPTLVLESTSGSICGTTPVTVSGNQFNGNATLVNLSTNGAGLLSPTSINTSPFAFTYTPAASDAGNNVTITATTNNPLGPPCVAAVANYTLKVNGNPSAPIVGAIIQPTCTVATGSVVLSGLPSGSWTINPGAISGTGTSTTISLLASGIYNFTVTNAAGCVSVASATVVINAQPGTPAAPIVGAIIQPTCTVATGSVVLSGLPSGTWTVNPGAVTGTDTSTTISSLSPGTYNFTVTNSSGCISAVSATVVVNDKPNCTPIAVNDSTSTPQGIPVTILVTSNDYDLDGTINVTTVDLNPSISGIQTSFAVPGQGNYTVNNLGVVTFNPEPDFVGKTTPVNYTVKDNLGATSNIATITIRVTQVDHPPKINLPNVITSVNTPVTICSPITDTDVGDTFTTSICRTPQNGTVDAPTISSDGRNVCVIYTPNIGYNGKDTICVSVCDHAGLCGNSTSEITVQLIKIDSEAKPVTCTGSKDGAINLTVTGGKAPYVYQWTGPGSFTSTSKDLTALSGGQYLVKVTDADGVFNAASATVGESDSLLSLTASPKAVIQTMSIDQTVILGVNPGSIQLTVSGGTAPFTYAWSGPGGFSSDAENIADLQGGTYTVTVVDDNGCSMTLSTKVDVQIVLSEDQSCVVIVPNVFTPNGDGINDYFEISCLYNYANAEIEIFNRNGNLLFKRDHYGNTDYWGSKEKAFWNGRSENSLNFMGSELPVGTYYYILKLGNGKVLTGFVFLAR